jgi:hypothetical protein
MSKQGMGFDGAFYWWEGAVEENIDPLGLGRCKVRLFAHNSPLKIKVSSEDLPWAYPVMPLNNPHGKIVALKPGTRVFGFSRDGISGQDLVMIGTINTGFDSPGLPVNFDESVDPYVPIELGSSAEREGDLGFIDDRVGAGEPIANQPQKTKVTMDAVSSSHENITDYGPLQTNEINVPRLARGIMADTITETHSGALASVTKASNGTIPEPENPFAAKYPFNTVEESDSGHLKEVDDTPGAERIKETHRTGTFYEIHPDGTKVTKVVKDDFSVTIGDKGVKVQGVCAVHVVGQADFYCEENINVKTNKTATVTALKDAIVNATDNVTVTAGKNATVAAGGDTEVSGEGFVSVVAGLGLDLSCGGLMTFADSSATAVNVDELQRDIVDGRGGASIRVDDQS